MSLVDIVTECPCCNKENSEGIDAGVCDECNKEIYEDDLRGPYAMEDLK